VRNYQFLDEDIVPGLHEKPIVAQLGSTSTNIWELRIYYRNDLQLLLFYQCFVKYRDCKLQTDIMMVNGELGSMWKVVFVALGNTVTLLWINIKI
jgi:hypothetical protein